jgi:lysine 6-dehydrogenase
VIGAEMQGRAAAYDMALHGDAAEITLADARAEIAAASAERVNGLIGQPIASPVALDVRDHAMLIETIKDHAVALSAVPYRFNLDITRAAIDAGVSLCDLGGNTAIVFEQLALHEPARAAASRFSPTVALCGHGQCLYRAWCSHARPLRPRRIVGWRVTATAEWPVAVLAGF